MVVMCRVREIKQPPLASVIEVADTLGTTAQTDLDADISPSLFGADGVFASDPFEDVGT